MNVMLNECALMSLLTFNKILFHLSLIFSARKKKYHNSLILFYNLHKESMFKNYEDVCEYINAGKSLNSYLNHKNLNKLLITAGK